MSTAFVGISMFVKPSPIWNARTEIWRVTPTRSPSGAIRGMVTKACPLPEGTKRFSIDCIVSIPTAASSGPTEERGTTGRARWCGGSGRPP
jgi:hypothetical protein